MNRELRLAITSSEENISWLSGAVHGVCSTMAMDEQSRYNVRLCIVEAVTNCVRHAYRGAPGRPIEIVMRQLDGSLQVSVLDQGEPIPQAIRSRAPLEEDPAPPPPLAEGGRGLFLINALMDEVRFSVDGPTNVLTMRQVVQVETGRPSMERSLKWSS